MRPELRPRRPGDVPDLDGGVSAEPLWVGPGTGPVVAGTPSLVVIGPEAADADGDGRPDTVVVQDDTGLVLFTDLDGDGLADQELRIPTGAPPEAAAEAEPVWWQPWTWFPG